jgi:hypothetical protein
MAIFCQPSKQPLSSSWVYWPSQLCATGTVSHPYLKKISLIAGGIALSAVLTLLEEQLAKMNAPGMYVAVKLFGGPEANIALIGYVWLSVDFLLWFSVLSGAYFLFAKFGND